MTHRELIEQFYAAFSEKNPEKMISSYHHDIEFEDPAFGKLYGEDARNMWKMLIVRAGDNLKISYSNVQADETTGKANWEAEYPFSKTKRIVHNKVKASFVFKDGKIIKHTDSFNFHKWASMALGPVGFLLGFTPIIKRKTRKECLRMLKKYSENLSKQES